MKRIVFKFIILWFTHFFPHIYVISNEKKNNIYINQKGKSNGKNNHKKQSNQKTHIYTQTLKTKAKNTFKI